MLGRVDRAHVHARLHPGTATATRARVALDRSLTPQRIDGEVAYLERRPWFERPYGLAWLLQLAAVIGSTVPLDLWAEIAAVVGLDGNTVRYHLDLLRKAGHVGRLPSARGPVFFKAEARVAASEKVEGPLPQRILDLVRTTPGLNTSEVARSLHVSKRAAQNHIERQIAACWSGASSPTSHDRRVRASGSRGDPPTIARLTALIRKV